MGQHDAMIGAAAPVATIGIDARGAMIGADAPAGQRDGRREAASRAGAGGGHDNAMGFLRLVLAALVIISHTPEMIDGSRVREPLTRLFGTISFGELAVDGFFVLSGYLIVASFRNSTSIADYLRRRVGRIFPGFAVATLLTLFVAAPLAGGDVRHVLTHLPRYLVKIVTLQTVDVPGILAGMPIPQMNAAVWTIGHEFRCYLLVILLGSIGLLRRPALIAAIAVALLAAYAAIPTAVLRGIGHKLPMYHIWMGEPDQLMRLVGIFLIGSLFYLWRGRLGGSRALVAGAASGLLLSLCVAAVAEMGVAIFGGYLLFWFANWGKGTVFSRINNRNDISYGVYLYGWPLGSLLIYAMPGVSPTAITAATILLSLGFGYASWTLVEKPSLRFVMRPRGLRTAITTWSRSPGLVWQPK